MKYILNVISIIITCAVCMSGKAFTTAQDMYSELSQQESRRFSQFLEESRNGSNFLSEKTSIFEKADAERVCEMCYKKSDTSYG